MTATRVILTVDTEPDIAGAMRDRKRYPPLIHEPVWGAVEGRSEGLGFITRTLSSYGLSATFFVETVHTRYFGGNPMKRYIDHLGDAGQDVQLHIHPVWQNFSSPESAGQVHYDDSAAMRENEMVALIEEGCDQIKDWTGQKPVAMRTGNFSASISVYRAMRQVGLRLASNICLAGSDYPDDLLPQSGGVHDIAGVYELPVSCFVDPGPVGKGRYRAVQITACSSKELIALLRQCSRQSVDTLILVTHPFEFIKKSDFRYTSLRPNLLVQRRLDSVCRYLSENSEHFDVTTFGALVPLLPLKLVPAPLLKSSVIGSLLRATQNFVNDRI
jgi:hypothetical protein